MSARCYGLHDLLTLAERLLAPVITAVRDEVRRPVQIHADPVPDPAIGIPITPTPDPVAGIPATPPSDVGSCFTTPGFPPGDERHACNGSGSEAASAAVRDPEVQICTSLPVPTDSTGSKADVPPECDAGIPASLASTADPLFVRRDRGNLVRYVVAAPDEPGERFRRLVKNGRARYERAT